MIIPLVESMKWTVVVPLPLGMDLGGRLGILPLYRFSSYPKASVTHFIASSLHRTDLRGATPTPHNPLPAFEGRIYHLGVDIGLSLSVR
ncbi:hypothetical protein NMY22_g8226 [Coprinellus aureogranulatus]|nr:hypothetical protein NMY22_g8226 [Coprinellus aureogranulatus]